MKFPPQLRTALQGYLSGPHCAALYQIDFRQRICEIISDLASCQQHKRDYDFQEKNYDLQEEDVVSITCRTMNCRLVAPDVL